MKTLEYKNVVMIENPVAVVMVSDGNQG